MLLFPATDFFCIQKCVGRVIRDEHVSHYYNIRDVPTTHRNISHGTRQNFPLLWKVGLKTTVSLNVDVFTRYLYKENQFILV